jgi:hypothetical protein
MRPKYYQIIHECVEAGCRYGVSRAHKHTDDPSYDVIETCVIDAIMMELNNKFSFTQTEETIDYTGL